MIKIPISPEVGEVKDSAQCESRSRREGISVRSIARFAGKAMFSLGVGLGAGIIGAHNDPSEVTIGPHRAEVTLGAPGYITGDLGPIGAGRLPIESDLVGVNITVKEIPTLAPGEQTLPLFTDLSTELTAGQAEEIGALYIGATQHSAEIEQALQETFVRWSLGGTALGAGALLAIGDRRLRELGAKKYIPILAIGMSLIPPTPIKSHAETTRTDWISTKNLFNGTGFEGFEVRGEALRLALPAVQEVVDFLEGNEQYYNQLAENIHALADRRRLLPSVDEDQATFIFITDQHCNIGMNRVINALSQRIDADLLLNAGDATFSGTGLESYCFDNLAIDGENIIALGNHDDHKTTAQQVKDAGFTVLQDEVVEAAGIRIYGDSDPRRSIFGQQTFYWRNEEIPEMGERVKKALCGLEEPVDLALVHDRKAGLPALEAGCVKTVLAGHTHGARIDELPFTDYSGISVLGGTSGGAAEGKPTFGPLENKATITIGRISRETGNMLYTRTVTIQPDQTIELDPLQFINQD